MEVDRRYLILALKSIEPFDLMCIQRYVNANLVAIATPPLRQAQGSGFQKKA
jgi:hypothetical protein